MTDARPVRLGFLGAALLAALPIGCARRPEDSGGLVVATTWPEADRRRVAAESAAPIRWLVLDPTDDLAALARRTRPPDVLLGGPLALHARLLPLEGTAHHMARSVPAGPSASTEGAGRRTGFVFDDPRRDPASLAWASVVLDTEGWEAGYARLVREAGGSGEAGLFSGAPRGAVGRGRTTGVTDGGTASQEAPGSEEGVTALADAPHPEAARSFVGRFPASETRFEEDAGLRADLLGSTLVDAGDELREARAALARAGAGDAGRAARWMTQPPPWPPASVAKILGRESDAMPLLETLAAQVAPEADARAWLLRSWLSPARSIDGAFLDELAGAVGGRLAREPRFRSWLRGEWTAWARQRYRRVARTAAGEVGRP